MTVEPKTLQKVNTAMKKVIVILLQLLLNITVLAQNPKFASTDLNLRSGPSTSSQVLAIIPSGTSIQIAENCAWARVYYDRIVGYVDSKYLTTAQIINSQSPVITAQKQRTKKKTKYYTNVDGHKVEVPRLSDSVPVGATALCRDGTYSFSRNRRGTCSHHGGVAKWLE
jgi:uncharacterized protein YraI